MFKGERNVEIKQARENYKYVSIGEIASPCLALPTHLSYQHIWKNGQEKIMA